ncbi:MAG TPA: tetratricopeptide repeat protein [Salinivirgaceae bacterium]|nr:tetratricopeptide repeat protein [Salinivirgaceae bacterium]
MRYFHFSLLLFFATLLSLGVLGQSRTIDSLLRLVTVEKEDTSKISLYIKLGDCFEKSNPDSNRYFTSKALELVKSIAQKRRNDKYGPILGKYQARLGKIYYQQKQYEKAVEYYYQSIKTFKHYEKSKNIEIVNHSKRGIIDGYFYFGLIFSEKENSDKSIEFYSEAIKLMEQVSDFQGMARSYNNIGTVYYYQGNLFEAIESYNKSIEIREQINDFDGIANNYLNIGVLYTDQGKFDLAIESYLKALKLKEEIGDKVGIAHCYNNIGNLHAEQNSSEKALEYYLKALEIRENIDDKEGISGCYTNIGITYSELGKYDKALEYYQKAIPIYTELLDYSGLADNYNNMGIVHRNKSEFFKAMEFFKKTFTIREKMNDRHGLAAVNSNIATTYSDMSSIVGREKSAEYLKLSLKHGLDALQLSQKIGSVTLQKAIVDGLVKSYKLSGDYVKALEYAQLSMELRDSLYKEEKAKVLAEMETHYFFDKNQQKIEIQIKRLENQQQIISNVERESERKNTYLLIAIISILILVFIAIFYVRKSRHKQDETNKLLLRLNREILQQKKEILILNSEIELKNSNILSDIEYIGAVQQSLLVSPQAINEVFDDYFLIFKPREILSGVFYLIKQNEQSIYIALANSMGHGVQNLLINLLGCVVLNEIVHNKISSHTNFALDEIREKIKNSLSQVESPDNQEKGLAIAFCIINKVSKKLYYSGARVPLLLVRQEDSKTEPILEIFEPDSQLIGVNTENQFVEKVVQLRENDSFYIFANDILQLEDKNRQELTEKQLQETILANSHKSMNEQGKNIETVISELQGNNGGADDILAFGVRI